MDADDDSKSCDLAHDPCRRLALEKDLGSPLSDGSVGSDSESSLLSPTPPHNLVTDLQSVTPKPRIWSIVDTATSSSSTGTCSTLTSSIVTTTGGATRLSPLQRAARLDYLSPYPKPASWYAGSLGATTTVTSSFPLSAVYSPIVPSASALSAVTPVSGVPPHSSHHSSESALSRLRTVAGTAFPTGDMAMPPKPSTVSTPTVFNLSANRLSTSTSSPSSGSSAAIAAVAGVSIGHLTSMSNRVVS